MAICALINDIVILVEVLPNELPKFGVHVATGLQTNSMRAIDANPYLLIYIHESSTTYQLVGFLTKINICTNKNVPPCSV